MEDGIQADGELEAKENDVVVQDNGTEPREEIETGEPGESTTEVVAKEITQETLDRAVSKQHIKQKKAETALELERQKVADLEAKIAAKPAETAPVIPELPDQFDDDYAGKMAERDQAIIKLGEFNRNEALVADQQKAAQANQVLSAQEEHKKLVEDYQAKAETLGVDGKELFDAENVVGAYIRNPDVAKFLMTDDNGPIAVSHLAKNPIELDKISKMSPMHAAIYISNTVIPAAVKLKPQTTKAPDPLFVPTGSGQQKKSHPANEGATFE